MKYFKNFLIFIGYLVVGAGVGLMIGRALAQTQLPIWLLILFVIIAIVAQIAIHEAGHLVAGLLSGYRFLSYRIFNLLWQKIDGKINFSFFSISGTLGQCLMIPPKPVDGKVPYLLYHLGGGLANIFSALVFYLLSFMSDNSVIFLDCLALFGLFFAVTNLIPMSESLANDGANILAISKNPKASLYSANTLAVHGLLAQGKSYSEMPDEYFLLPEKEELDNHIAFGALAPYLSRLIEQEDFQRVVDYLETLNLDTPTILPIYQAIFKSLLIYCQLILEQETSPILTKKDWKLIQALSPSQPSLLVFNYAYYSLVESNAKEAEKALAQFTKLGKNYHLPSEYQIEQRNLAHFQAIIAKNT